MRQRKGQEAEVAWELGAWGGSGEKPRTASHGNREIVAQALDFLHVAARPALRSEHPPPEKAVFSKSGITIEINRGKQLKSLQKRNACIQFRFIWRTVILGHRQPRSTSHETSHPLRRRPLDARASGHPGAGRSEAG